VLAFFSAFAGIWLLGYKKVFPTLPTNTLENWLASGAPWGSHAAKHSEHGGYPEIPFGQFVPFLGYSVGIIGMLIGVAWYYRGLPKSEGWDLSKWSNFRKSAGNQFGFDNSMVEMGVEGGGAFSNFAWKILDVKLVDGIINGFAKIVGGLGLVLRSLQSGYARSYALMILAGAASILAYVVFALSQRGKL